jgi:hypothetical protein
MIRDEQEYLMQKIKTRMALLAGALSIAASTLVTSSARAVVLEEKWQAGQQLSYDMKVDGTLNLTAPEGTAMIGGLPLEILIKGDGQSTLLTTEVDEFGTGTVGLRVDRLQLKLNETTFGQNGILGIRDGKANFSLNGQAAMPTTDVSQYLAPPYGVRMTKQLHAVGTSPLRKEEAPAPDDKTAAKGPLRMPLGTLVMVQALMARSLPALLPAGDVAAGQEWKANIEWPQPPQLARPEMQQPMGEFAMKAVGEEEVLGRKAWRIALDGVLKIDEAQARIISEEIEKGRANKGEENADAPRGPLGKMAIPKLIAFTQKIKGDFWFDADAGQIVRADLQTTSDVQTRKDEKSKAADGKMNYAGNLQLELRKMSYENQ